MAPALPGIPRAPAIKEVVELGEQMINGVLALGKRYSLPQMSTSEIWTSQDLQLLVRSALNDPLTGTSCVTDMKNIKAGKQLDPGIFKVPPDFQIVSPAPPALPIKT
jgi:hypothetical protein